MDDSFWNRLSPLREISLAPFASLGTVFEVRYARGNLWMACFVCMESDAVIGLSVFFFDGFLINLAEF